MAAVPAIVAGLMVGTGLGGQVAQMAGLAPRPDPKLQSLKMVTPPDRPGINNYIKDHGAALQLGKALFWDMQAGSDGVTACATCHYQAGADIRSVNQIRPGANGKFDLNGAPNYSLKAADFPLHKLADPNNAGSAVLSDADDVVGSQGVFSRGFGDITAGAPVDNCAVLADGTFNIHGAGNVRQVTGRNTPSAINAVFNYRNFWDGRAQNAFNGKNPFGPRDPNAMVWQVAGAEPVQVKMSIPNSSLASQAVGPALSSVEMSCAGRAFPDLGHKLLNLTPLAHQQVAQDDSVLGGLSAGMGLNTDYKSLIQQAFNPAFTTDTRVGDGKYSQIEANFSMFWGLAIQEYESTLISNDSRVDQYLDGNKNALNSVEVKGMGVFQSKCAQCHLGAETTAASVRNVSAVGTTEHISTASGASATGETGFANIGVRPTGEDMGVGGDGVGGSWSEAKLHNVAGAKAVDGSFMIPSVRNVELNGPYFHDGSQATLRQVVDFYSRGGDFGTQNAANVDVRLVQARNLGESDKQALVSFLMALTDERVRTQKAPFDHPQLCLPNGPSNAAFSAPSTAMAEAMAGEAQDSFSCLNATGKSGGAALQPFLNLNEQMGNTSSSSAPVVTNGKGGGNGGGGNGGGGKGK